MTFRPTASVISTQGGDVPVHEVAPGVLRMAGGFRGTEGMTADQVKLALDDFVAKCRQGGYDCVISPAFNNPAFVRAVCDITGIRIFRHMEEVTDLEALKAELAARVDARFHHHPCVDLPGDRFLASIPLNGPAVLPYCYVQYEKDSGRIVAFSREKPFGETDEYGVARTPAPLTSDGIERYVVRVMDGVVLAIEERRK